MKLIVVIMFFFAFTFSINAQQITLPAENIIAITSSWKGERFADGRPKVSNNLLQRLKNCTLEQIWGFLNKRGFRNQIEKNWEILKHGETMVGRAVTTQFMPSRPDLDSVIRATGKKEGKSQHGGINTWPIDVLTTDDIYVADGFGKIKNGTLIGSSLGNAIYGKSGRGVVFFGSIRDMQELKDTKGFNAWIKGSDPSYIVDMTPVSINALIRIGEATVFPGDVVFANDYGVAFIPAYLVEPLVTSSEMIALKDEFERYMLQSGKYPSGEIHGNWSENIKNEFRKWFSKYPKKTAITSREIEDYLQKQND
ncbi:MAG: RraA family protein [Ginsengibacter sp.]